MTEQFNDKDLEVIYLAGVCFWGVEDYMKKVEGVVDSISGYANGNSLKFIPYDEMEKEGYGYLCK